MDNKNKTVKFLWMQSNEVSFYRYNFYFLLFTLGFNTTHCEIKKNLSAGKRKLINSTLVIILMFAIQTTSDGGRAGYLFTGRWKFIRFSCEIDQIIENGLQVGHLSKHVDLIVLHTYINGNNEWSILIWLIKHKSSTDQHRFQHADEAAVTCSFFNKCSAHCSLLCLLKDSITNINVLQCAVQLTPSLILPYRHTHTHTCRKIRWGHIQEVWSALGLSANNMLGSSQQQI